MKARIRIERTYSNVEVWEGEVDLPDDLNSENVEDMEESEVEELLFMIESKIAGGTYEGEFQLDTSLGGDIIYSKAYHLEEVDMRSGDPQRAFLSYNNQN